MRVFSPFSSRCSPRCGSSLGRLVMPPRRRRALRRHLRRASPRRRRRASGDVEFAELEQVVRKTDLARLPQVEPAGLPDWTPNDTRYASQWAPSMIRLPEAWPVTAGAPTVKIAVVDTGVSAAHPDLA